MSRRLIAVVFVLTLSGCASSPPPRYASWGQCAQAEAVKLLEPGISTSWAQSAALPEGQEIRSVDLGQSPPEAIADGFMRVLHLAPGMNAFYVKQTGGFAGVNQLFGPVSLRGRCPAPKPGAP